MSNPLTFTLRQPLSLQVDALVPDKLMTLQISQIAALPLQHDGKTYQVGELFAISGADASRLRFCGATAQLSAVGAAMRQGTIEVMGDLGDDIALSATGGQITVHGNVGDRCAQGLSGGRLLIHGRAGNDLGGPLPGATHGMAGGVVWVGGHVGQRAGDRLRRGMMLIEGDAGDFCASRMIAGTVAVGGHCGRFPGVQMKRGTLLLSHLPQLPCTFIDQGMMELPFLRLLVSALRDLQLPGSIVAAWTANVNSARAHRILGDLSVGGIGELLIADAE